MRNNLSKNHLWNDDISQGKEGLEREKERRKIAKVIPQLRHQIEESCYQSKESLVTGQESTELVLETMRLHPDYVSASLPQQMIYYVVLFAFPCAYLFNLLLIYSPVEFMVSQNLGSNTFWSKLAILVLPAAFLLFEVVLSTLIFLVKDKPQNQKISEKFALVMVCITPTLLLATYVAKWIAEKRLPGIHEILLLLALMALAFVTDAVIVYGINTMNHSVSFVVFKIQTIYYQKQAKVCKVKARKKASEADHILTELLDTVHHFNDQYPDSEIALPRFNRITQEIINWWKGYDFFPDHSEPPNDAGHTPRKPSPLKPDNNGFINVISQDSITP